VKLAMTSQPGPSPSPYPSPARGEGTFLVFRTFLTRPCWAWTDDFFQTRFLPLPGGTCQGEPEGRAQTSGNAGKELFFCFPFFFCVPKRRNKKKAPQPVLALRASLTSRRGRDAEKLGLRPQTVPASFPPPSARRGRTNGGRKGKSHWHAAEHRRGCRKGDLHCLSAASLQSPGSIEEHRASRLRRDKCLGALSLVRFFGQAKK